VGSFYALVYVPIWCNVRLVHLSPVISSEGVFMVSRNVHRTIFSGHTGEGRVPRTSDPIVRVRRGYIQA
jgi:hypothetical protein